MASVSNDIILCIGDLHCPFQHIDAFAFLAEIKKVCKPTRIILMGDEIDGNSFSFHNADPDLFSPGDELERAIIEMKNLYKLFPRADVLESNHGSLFTRKLKAFGLPLRILKSHNDIIGAPKQWKWHFDMHIKLPNGQMLYLHHGKTGRFTGLSKTMGCNSIQGHFHGRFGVDYWSNGRDVHFDAFSGCLIDAEEMAFEYGRNNLPQPILGSVIIKDSVAIPIPMRVDSKNRWVGYI